MCRNRLLPLVVWVRFIGDGTLPNLESRPQASEIRQYALLVVAWSRAVCHSANREVSVAATEHEVSSVFFRRVLKLDFGAHQPEILEFTRVSEQRLVVPSDESDPRPRWESLAAPADGDLVDATGAIKHYVGNAA